MKKFLMCAVCLLIACGVADAKTKSKVQPIYPAIRTNVVMGCVEPVAYEDVQNVKIVGNVLSFEQATGEFDELISGDFTLIRRTSPDCWELEEVLVDTQ